VQRDTELIAAGTDRLAAELLLRSAGVQSTESEALRTRLEGIERRSGDRSWSSSLMDLNGLQADLARLRREANLQADIALGLSQAAGPHIHDANRVYFRAAHQQLMAVVARTTTLEERADRLVTMQLPLAAGRLQSAVRWLALAVAALLAAVLVGLYVLIAYRPG
jgi:Mg2+ and Co2+ transporter CorA